MSLPVVRICAGKPHDWLQRHRGKRPLFACILSFTETANIPNVSAAGTTPQARQFTALVDGEILLAERPAAGGASLSQRLMYEPPTLAAGVSPALISRAILTRQQIPCRLFSTGFRHRLAVPHIALPAVLAKPLYTGQAMTYAQTQQLFESGLHWGRRLAQAIAQQNTDGYLIVGECVAGGTTTAQAVLTALGYHVANRMSSSHPAGNHHQKQALVAQGLLAWQQRRQIDLQNAEADQKADARSLNEPLDTALEAVAAVGDPMQAIAAGMALAAGSSVGVMLAGGSQMLAVYALAKQMASGCSTKERRTREQLASNQALENIVVGTTRWVVDDRSADTVAIAQAIGAPYLASEIEFSQSPWPQLRAYERGAVKEGVGAGGCAIAANLYQGWTRSQIRHAVEAELREYL